MPKVDADKKQTPPPKCVKEESKKVEREIKRERERKKIYSKISDGYSEKERTDTYIVRGALKGRVEPETRSRASRTG